MSEIGLFLILSVITNSFGIKMRYTKALLALIFLFLLSSCNLIDPPASESDKLELSLLDTSSKEVYLRIKTGDRFINEEITLKRNGFSLMKFRASRDTVICDTLLRPNTKYTYQIAESGGLGFQKHSEKVIASTLSTTSHNVSWQIYYIGEAGFDDPWDVEIIDENNIWVSGNFTRNESGVEKYYNLVKWDGLKWSDDAALYKGSIYGVLYSIFAFSKSDVWVGNNTPAHGEGKNWFFYGEEENYPEMHTWIRKIWGTSSADMYFAGENGSVLKYDGKSWKLVTEVSAGYTTDIWGYKDEITGEKTVYCPLTFPADLKASKLIRIYGNDQADFISFNAGMEPSSVWTHRGYPVYVAGTGLYYYTPGRWKDAGLVTNKFVDRVRGSALNDIFVSGAMGLLAHYNGIDWMVYPEFSDHWDVISSLNVKGNTIAAVGVLNNKVAVAVGKRN